MTNGGINVEIGNPSYNMYEVDHDNHADAGSLLRPNFTLDPHKVGLLNSLTYYTKNDNNNNSSEPASCSLTNTLCDCICLTYT